MSSLLTNNSAMVALQTLKTINKNMGEVQNQISTGKRIATARDNAALWGISTTMQTDVTGFKAISESLSLGSATLSVGRDAAETITSLLDQMKGKIVAAQEDNVDRNKIQTDVDALRVQIATVTDAAQFNGLNLLQGREQVQILSSLNRTVSDAGVPTVTDDQIRFNKQDLTRTAGSLDATSGTVTGVTALTATNAAAQTQTMTATTGTTADAAGEGGFDFRIALASGNIDITIDTTQGMSVNDLAAEIRASVQAEIDGNAALAGFTVSGDGAEVILTGNGFDNFTTSLQGNGTGAVVGGIGEQTATAVDAFSLAFDTEIVAGQGYQINVAGLDNPIIYQATATDTVATVASALAAAVNTAGAAIGVTARVGDPADPAADPTLVRVAYSGSDPANREISSASANESTANGGLFALEAIDVSTKEGAENALAAIEGLIQTAISAAAAFGSAQGRIQTQTEFVSKLMDGFTSGIGVLVDADMEAASARLQALQVQQQLGIQALSIANQSPQNILALFR